MISDVLIPKLRERFASHGLQVGVPPDSCAVFPAVHADIGDIVITDEGHELTLQAGRFTHGHFSNYDQNLSATQKAERISDDIVQFLDDVFADRIDPLGLYHDERRLVSARRAATGVLEWSRRTLRVVGSFMTRCKELRRIQRVISNGDTVDLR